MSNPLTSLALAVLTALLLLALSGYQVTGETAGHKLLGRLAVSLVELERWVPAHRDDIQLLARDRPDESVLIDDLPVDVVLPSSAVLAVGDNNEALTAMLRQAMARRLYTEGRGVLQDEAGGTHLGVTEPVRWAVTLIGEGMHSTWRLVLPALALLTAALAGACLLSRRSPLLPMAAGAMLGVVGSFLVWLVAGGLASGFESSVDREIVLMLKDGAWLGLRNSLAAVAVLLALLFLYRSLIAPRLRRDEFYWSEDGEDEYPYDTANMGDSTGYR